MIEEEVIYLLFLKEGNLKFVKFIKFVSIKAPFQT